MTPVTKHCRTCLSTPALIDATSSNCNFRQLCYNTSIYIKLSSTLRGLVPAIDAVLVRQGIRPEHLGTLALANWIKLEIEQAWVKLYNSLEKTVCFCLGPLLRDAYSKVSIGENCEQNMKNKIWALVRKYTNHLNERLQIFGSVCGKVPKAHQVLD
jgi:hypothetical protein